MNSFIQIDPEGGRTPQIEPDAWSLVVLYNRHTGEIVHSHQCVTTRGGTHPSTRELEDQARAHAGAALESLDDEVGCLHTDPRSIKPDVHYRVDTLLGRLVEEVRSLAIEPSAMTPSPGPPRPTTDPPVVRQIGPAVDACTSASPDVVFYVPMKFSGEATFASAGAAYYYRSGCKRFIVDILMAGYSHQNPNSQGQWEGPGLLWVSAGPYDLPSSEYYGGSSPAVKEDCTRLSYSVRYYRKRSTESAFTLLGTRVTKDGVWNGTCNPNTTTTGTPPLDFEHTSGGGWDTLRVAVQVMLRSSAQEAGVFLTNPLPK